MHFAVLFQGCHVASFPSKISEGSLIVVIIMYFSQLVIFYFMHLTYILLEVLVCSIAVHYMAR